MIDLPRIDETLTLTKNGLWLSNGHEISHVATCRAFARFLVQTPSGFQIIIGNESKDVLVEDTPAFVEQIEGSPNTGIQMRLTDLSTEKLDPSTLKYSPGRLTCMLMNLKPMSIKKFEAKFLPQAYFDLLSFCEQDAEGYFIQFGPTRINL